MLPTATSPHGNAGGSSKDRGHTSTTRLRICGALYVAGMILCYLFVLPHFRPAGSAPLHSSTSFGADPAQPQLVDVFPGEPWRTEQTLASKLLLSDKRMRVESHTVKGEDGKVYDDWIWMDVVDQVNVIPYVLAPPPSDASARAQWNRWRGGEFLVFRQRKYGLRGESLAVAGGQVEMALKESPLAAAQRELAEELFLWGTAADWVDLGSYRVNVNRGHGTISCFLVAGAQALADRTGENAEFKVDELERQRVVRLGFDAMEAAVRQHQFAEIKWAATAALALDVIRTRIQEEDARLGLGPSAATRALPIVTNSPPSDDGRAAAAAEAQAEAQAETESSLLTDRASEDADAQASAEQASMAHRREMNVMDAAPQQAGQQPPAQQQIEGEQPASPAPSDAAAAAAADPVADSLSVDSAAPAASASPSPAAVPASDPSEASEPAGASDDAAAAAAASLNLPPVPPKRRGSRRDRPAGFGKRSQRADAGRAKRNTKRRGKGKGQGSRAHAPSAADQKRKRSRYAKAQGKKSSEQQ